METEVYRIPEEKIIEISKNILNELKNKPKIKFFDETEKIQSGPGVYMIVDLKTNPVYVGESNDVKERYHDLRDTRNHVARRHLGEDKYRNEKNYRKSSSTDKFPEDIEIKLNNYFTNNLRFLFIPISFGRVEIQDAIIKILSNSGIKLYNKPQKRGK